MAIVSPRQVSSGYFRNNLYVVLGHWYLNAPGMKLPPLRLLIAALLFSVGLRAAVAIKGLALASSLGVLPSGGGFWMLVLRWCTGLVGTMVTALMAWQTLRIPN